MQDFRRYVLSLTLCILAQNVGALPRVDPLVDTNLGLIRGLMSNDGTYSMFMGIPYALVDENNPFGPSIPHPGFSEAFEAFNDSAICPQIEEFNSTIVGTLDCLHLNIYVPQTASSRNRLPVLVWIYGGGFSIGFSGRYLYGPSYFVRHDVILVTLNYRVGPYGFMCLNTPEVPGNQGLKDQQLALKWIKENIEAFGGDSGKITLYGESAGGVSVDVHLTYSDEPVFDKLIMQSGTAFIPGMIADPNYSSPLILAEHLGFETENLNDALDFLGTVDTKLVIAATNELGLMFRPCVEQSFDNVHKLIGEYPANVNLPNLRNIPMLIGFNSDERVADYGSYIKEMEEGTSSLIDYIFYQTLETDFNFANAEEIMEMEQFVRHFYIGDESLSPESIRSIIDLSGDFTFYHSTLRRMQQFAQNGAENIFHYMFSYVGGRNFVKLRNNVTVGGAAHADEMGYQFDISYMSEPNAQDQLVIDRMSTLWTNFVKYGNPTPEANELLPVTWTPITKDVFTYLNIDSELSIDSRPFHKRMSFWDLFYKLNRKTQKGFVETQDQKL